MVDVWERDKVPAVMALVDEVLPGELLSEDDVVANLFDDPDPVRVVGLGDDDGFAAAVVREASGRRVAHIQLLAVANRAQRTGVGRTLVEALHGWAFEEMDAEVVVAGAGAPFYLFAGVDVRATAALCLFEALGYRPRGAELNLSFSSRFRAPPPSGVVVRRVLEEVDAEATDEFCARHWPNWIPELRRGIEHGACHAAFDAGGAVMGFGCHSVNRMGWLGPIAADPARQGGGVGSALLSAISKDVMAAGLDTVEVSWIGPVRFYVKAANASVSRVFRSLALPRPRRA